MRGMGRIHEGHSDPASVSYSTYVVHLNGSGLGQRVEGGSGVQAEEEEGEEGGEEKKLLLLDLLCLTYVTHPKGSGLGKRAGEGSGGSSGGGGRRGGKFAAAGLVALKHTSVVAAI